MSIEELRTSNKEMLSMKDISGIIKVHSSRLKAYAIDGQLQKLFGGGVIISGNRAKVSKAAFLRWYDGTMGGQSNGTTEAS